MKLKLDLTSNSGTFFDNSTNGNSLTKTLMKKRSKTKMSKEMMISKKTSKRKFEESHCIFLNVPRKIIDTLLRMKEANALQSSHIEQSAIYFSRHGRLSTGYNWKRSKCEQKGPGARRVSWVNFRSNLLRRSSLPDFYKNHTQNPKQNIYTRTTEWNKFYEFH